LSPTVPTLAPGRRARLIKAATYASVTVAVFLVVIKTWAWRETDSVSLLSSLADSLLDVLASLLTFWAVRFSLSPADAEHRFGHGKSEGLAALFQSVIIMGSGGYVCFEAVRRILVPEPVSEPATGIAVILASLAATLALVLFQRHVSRKTGSVAIEADALHYRTDLAVNLSVLAALALTAWTGVQVLDPLVGLGVAAYILWSAVGIAGQSLDILLDREIPNADRDRIRALALEHPAVLGFHDMRTRHGGSNYIVQFHLELDPAINLTRAHVILDEVEERIRANYPGCEIIIHPDPLGFAEERDEFSDQRPERASLFRRVKRAGKGK
jgi:ferrous-iron efflux pump FieF